MTDGTEVAKPFTIDQVNEQLKARVRESFLSIIPESAWDQFIKDEYDRLLQETPDPSRRFGGKRMFPPALRLIVREVATEIIREQLKEEFSKPEWSTLWSGSQYVVGEKMQEVITKAAPDIIAALLTSAVGGAVQGMQNRF